MTDDAGELAACARCCTPRPPHELNDSGGEQVCADTAACQTVLPPLVDLEHA